MGTDQKVLVQIKEHSCAAKARADLFTVDLNRSKVSSVLLLKELLAAFQSSYCHVSDFSDRKIKKQLRDTVLKTQTSNIHHESQAAFWKSKFFQLLLILRLQIPK